VFAQGDPADALFYIQSGKVKVTRPRRQRLRPLFQRDQLARAAIDTRVSASQTLTVSGGMHARPRSLPRRRRLPSKPIRPLTAPRTRASRRFEQNSADSSPIRPDRANRTVARNCRGSSRRTANRPLAQFLDVSGGKNSMAHATLCSAKRSDQRNEKHSTCNHVAR
jgi:hypothetical protein